MKLNDPFGRIASREEKEYQSLRNTLEKSNVKTILDAEYVMERLQSRKTKVVYAVLGILLLLGFIFPKAFALIVFLAALAVLWVLKTTKNARRYIKRYIEEELKDKGKQT